jgi:hypothetical protein
VARASVMLLNSPCWSSGSTYRHGLRKYPFQGGILVGEDMDYGPVSKHRPVVLGRVDRCGERDEVVVWVAVDPDADDPALSWRGFGCRCCGRWAEDLHALAESAISPSMTCPVCAGRSICSERRRSRSSVGTKTVGDRAGKAPTPNAAAPPGTDAEVLLAAVAASAAIAAADLLQGVWRRALWRRFRVGLAGGFFGASVIVPSPFEDSLSLWITNLLITH